MKFVEYSRKMMIQVMYKIIVWGFHLKCRRTDSDLQIIQLNKTIMTFSKYKCCLLTIIIKGIKV